MLDVFRQRLRDDGSVTIDVRARPGAPDNRIVAVLADGSVKADLAAAPEDGAANIALVKLFAEAFGVSQHNVALTAGYSARRKRVRITA